jgi:hypothetical protein
MNLESVKNKALSGLKNKTSNIAVSFSDIKDENFSKYKYGEHSIYQFVESITEESPYSLVETFENNFLILDKKVKLPAQSYLNPKLLKDLFTEDNVQKLCKNLPEINDLIMKSYEEVKSASCTGCAKNGKTHRIIQEMLFLDNRNKDLSELIPIFGEKFIEKINSSEPLPRPPQRPEMPQPSHKRASEKVTDMVKKEAEVVIIPSPRPSCVECCMKHIGTAIVLMEEAANGYPSHRWIAVGELNEAANEMSRDFPEIAHEIREVRHLVTKDSSLSPDLMMLLNKLDSQFFAFTS